MHYETTKQRTRIMAAGLVLLAGFAAGAAYAEGDKLDEAKATTAKAIQLLRAAESPGTPQANDAHRKKAIEFLVRAHGEILKAKGE